MHDIAYDYCDIHTTDITPWKLQHLLTTLLFFLHVKFIELLQFCIILDGVLCA